MTTATTATTDEQDGYVRATAERFHALCVPEPNSGCWLWLGAVARPEKPYGQFWYERRQHFAHRASFKMHRGPIPEGMLVCHRCDQPSCVNPDHLFLGTAQENTDDMVRKGRARFAAHNSGAKLTEADVAAIRASSKSNADIAKIYGMHPAHISAIRRGRHWK